MSSQCAECGVSVDVAARFCGGCGTARDVPEETAEQIAHYRKVFEGFAQSGALGAKEHTQLEVLRGRLGITRSTHARLLSELQPSVIPCGVRLWIDLSTFNHFIEGHRCLIRFRIRNESDLAYEWVEVRASINADQTSPARTSTVFPGEDAETSAWFTPDQGGFAELSGEITSVDLMGAGHTLIWSGFEFRIGAGGPQVQVVNIDQRSARVVDNSRSSFGQSHSAGVVQDHQWHEIQLLHKVVTTTESTQPESVPGEPVDFVIDTAMGHYNVKAVVGYGDIATIYGGDMDTPHGARRKAVVKIADDPGDNDLIQREARTLRLLTDPDSRQRKHLPELIEQFQTPDGRCGNILGHLDGYDLIKVRQKYPDGIPDVHLMWLMRRCLSALGWAHSQGVLHGNLEPSHILVRPQDHNIWLIDWCWSVVNPAITGDKFKALNEPYSAPEVASNKAPIPPSDLYALGKCMIYAAGGDPATGAIPDRVDERLARMLEFFTRPSPMQRAQDAWSMYTRLESLRDEIFGEHEFRKFDI